MDAATTGGVRPAILIAWVACLAVAMAPWLTGGREPVAQVLSGFALLLGALLAWRQPAVAPLRRGLVWWGYAGLMAWAAASWFWTANHYSTTIWLISWGLVGLAFRVSYLVSYSERGRRWLEIGYLVVAGALAVAGIAMYLLGDYDRLTGPIYWPNPAAAYLMPALFIGLWRWLRAEKRRDLWIWGSLLALYATAFDLTGSRAAMVVFGFLTALFLIVFRRTNRFWTKIVFILLATMVLSTILVWAGNQLRHRQTHAVISDRIAEVAVGQSQSGRDRLSYLSSAFEMWFARPLTGFGAGNYGDVHPQYQHTVTSASTDAHNIYVQVLAELGLPGAVALATLLLGVFLGMARGLISRPQLVPVAFGLVGLLVHFGMDIDTRYPALLILAAVLAGMLVMPWRQIELRRASWVWPALAAVLLAPVVMLYQSDVAAQRGKVAQSDEDFTAAIEWFDQAGAGMFSNPDWISAAGINRLALAVSGSGEQGNHADEFDAALASARQAEGLDPHDAQHWQLEGRILQARPGTDFHLAQQAFEHALALDSLNHPEYALDLARLQLKYDGPDAARATAERMLVPYTPGVVANRESDPNLRDNVAELAALVGNINLEAGNVRRAGDWANAAIVFQPQNLAARALKHQVEKLQAQPQP